MAAPGHPALWRCRKGEAVVHILAGRPALAGPWTAPLADAALAASRDFWNETPETGADAQALVFRYGVNPGRPLAKAITKETETRVVAAAGRAGIPPATLSPLRPWLASIMLRGAFAAKDGLDPQSAPEVVFRERARSLSLRLYSEFPTTEAILQYFATLPPEAEAELLEVALDELEEGPAAQAQRAEYWLQGHLEHEADRVESFRRRYPAFHEALGAARNQAWIPRITRMLDDGGGSFLVIGVGHLVGGGSVIELLEASGVKVERL